MLKKITHIFLMGIVILSLLAPSVLPLLEIENDAIVLVDITEEEKSKDSKKELEEKDVFFQEVLRHMGSMTGELSGANYYYLLKTSDYSHTILLPPPEGNC